MDKKYIAAATLMGTMIGAGYLGIPAAISSTGLLPGIIMLLLVASLTIRMNIYTGELVSKVKDTHQMTGFAQLFLGDVGKKIMFISVFIGLTGAILAYTVAISDIVQNLLGVPTQMTIIAFTSAMSYLIFRGVDKVSKTELLLVSIMVIFLTSISIYLLPSVLYSNLSSTNWGEFVSPYGVLLFAFLGYSAIPELEKIVSGNKKKLRQSIIMATTSVAALYILFAFSFVGTFGENVEDVAVASLTGVFGWIGSLLAIITMTTAYLSLGLVMKDTYVEDFGVGNKLAVFFALSLPFAVSILTKPTFLTVIGITGAISGGLTGILICLMVLKMKRKKFDPLLYLLMLVFFFGALAEVF